tara:strand:- start:482 stop:673 length:192 start_codon:yes stop_codon:yes gene_type:complete
MEGFSLQLSSLVKERRIPRAHNQARQQKHLPAPCPRVLVARLFFCCPACLQAQVLFYFNKTIF